MKPISLTTALMMLLAGCEGAKPLRPNTVDAEPAALTARCEALQEVLVRLAIDSTAALNGQGRQIVHLRRERTRACEAARTADRQLSTSPT